PRFLHRCQRQRLLGRSNQRVDAKQPDQVERRVLRGREAGGLAGMEKLAGSVEAERACQAGRYQGRFPRGVGGGALEGEALLQTVTGLDEFLRQSGGPGGEEDDVDVPGRARLTRPAAGRSGREPGIVEPDVASAARNKTLDIVDEVLDPGGLQM